MADLLPCVRCRRAYQSAAAALATIAQFHGLPVGAGELASLAGLPSVKELGELVVAARLLGFDSVPLEGGYDDLPEVARPSLVPFKDGRFVVVYEIDGASVRVANPLTGLARLTREQFIERWTGDCLQIRPGALDRARARLVVQRSLWRRLAAPPRAPKAFFAAGVAAVAALVAANRGSFTACALGLAATSALWLALFHARCAACDRAHQLAGALPLDRLGALFYAALLLAALRGGWLVAGPLDAAAGAHLALAAILLRERTLCRPCLVTAASAIAAALAGARAPSLVAAGLLAAGGAAAAALAIPFFRGVAERRARSEAQRVALDWLRGAGDLPPGQVRVAVWRRSGCPACLFYEAVFKPALVQDFDGVVSFDERDAAGLHIPAPLILVAGGARTLFLGLSGRDDDYAALEQAVAAARAPTTAGALVLVEPARRGRPTGG